MYKPSRIMGTFHIAGFQHHDGALVIGKLKPGKKLKMAAEHDNPYDPDAVALLYKGTMLGYVPRAENGLIAQLMRFGHKGVFEARVMQVDPEADPWNQVRVGVYVVDKRG